MTTDRLQEARERIAKQRAEREQYDPAIEFMQMGQDLEQTGRAYPHRDEIPPALLAHADNYVNLTGQEPDKRTLSDWISEFTYWETKGLQPADIKAAWENVDFFVTRPGSLSSVAIAMKAKRRQVVHSSHIFRASDQKEVQAVPQPRDLYEETRQRLREKAVQDKVGLSAHEPKPIGDVMKGMQHGRQDERM